MADTEMATTGSFDAVASYARLSERVENQGRDIVDLRSNMNTGFRNIEGSIKALSDQLASGGKPQWQAIGVALTFAVVIGGMAYWPIREQQSDLKSALATVSENMVTREELDWRAGRGAEDRTRTEAAIKELRSEQVSRGEHEQKWASYDIQLRDLQRQADEVKRQLSEVYSPRDALLDVRERLERLERMQSGTP